MLGMVSMGAAVAYVCIAYSVFALIWAATDIALAVMYSREYYRHHPDAKPPDKILVRLGLRGIR